MQLLPIELVPIGVVLGGRNAPIDGSPVIDLKPTMQEFLPRGELRQPRWSRELMSGYW